MRVKLSLLILLTLTEVSLKLTVSLKPYSAPEPRLLFRPAQLPYRFMRHERGQRLGGLVLKTFR